MKLNKLYQSILYCSMAVPTVGIAQSDEKSEEELLNSLDEIVVTGSYIKRDKFDMASPIETIDAIDIQTSGYSNIGPYLRDLTYTANVDTVANVLGVSDGQQDSNSARFNLRGLGTSSTLTLFDGRRVLNSGAVAAIVPDIALSQVDVILDGGAALYGTDAVAGVVNMVPIRNYDGFKVTGYYTKDAQWTTEEPKISALWGTSSDQLDVVAALEYSERSEPMYRSDRPEYLRADNDSSPLGNPGSFNRQFFGNSIPGIDPECGTANEGNTDDGQVGSYPSGIPALPISASLPAYFCLFEYGAYQDYKRPYENLTAYVSTTYQLNEDVSLNVLINHNDRTSKLIASPSTGEIGSNTLLLIPENNPANNLAVGATQVAARPFYWRPFSNNGATQPSHLNDHGSEETEFSYVTSSIALGTEFDIGDSGWSGETYYTLATTKTNISGRILNLDRLQQALRGDGGASGNQWFNPFFSASALSPSYNGCEIGTAAGCTGNDQALVDWMYQKYDYNATRTDYQSIEGFATGDIFELPGGTVQLAVGAQFREEKYKIQGSTFQRMASTEFPTAAEGGGPANQDYNSAQVNGVRGKSISQSEVQSVFFETLVPILSNLELTVAARYEDFKDLDVSAAVPKVSLRYEPIESLSLRASAGEGFLAPTLEQVTDVDSPSCAEVFAGNDPALDGALAGTLSCSDGNPALEPEESTIYNIGATWKATDNLELSLDYQQIDYTDRIVRLGQLDTLRLDLANFLASTGMSIDQWDDMVENNPAAAEAAFAPWANSANSNQLIVRNPTTLAVEQVTRQPGNVAEIEVDVIDFRAKYSRDLGKWGFASANWSTTWYTKYDYLDAFGDIEDAAGQQNGQTDIVPPLPEFKHQLRLNWLMNHHSVGFTFNHTDEVEFDASIGPTYPPGLGYTGDTNGIGTAVAPEKIDAQTIVDFRYSYTFEEAFNGRLDLSLGSNNVFDEKAQALPVVGGLETRLQDPTGRTYYMEATYTFN